MGNHSTINEECRLDNRGGITIGDNVSISAQVCILTADHDPGSPTFAGRERAVRIDDHVFIGTRAMILPGVTIGRGAVVAAGAVVTEGTQVPPGSLVMGVPARVVRDVDDGLRARIRGTWEHYVGEAERHRSGAFPPQRTSL